MEITLEEAVISGLVREPCRPWEAERDWQDMTMMIVEVGITRRISSINGGKKRVNMNAWGSLPIPSTTLPLPGTAPETSNGGVFSANMKKAHSHHGARRKHKKEKRGRKVAAATTGVLVVEMNSSLHGYSAPYSAGEGVDVIVRFV